MNRSNLRPNVHPILPEDIVGEKGHGCAPIPFNDQAIHALQQSDARCARK